MIREPYWECMARRLREVGAMQNVLHRALDDVEKRKISSVYSEVDLLKMEVSQLQRNLYNAYKRIAELQDLVSKYKRNSGAQLEFNFEC